MDSLKAILAKFILAIGWTIAVIIMIAPKICSRKIKIEIDHVLCVKHQRRLNLPIYEVIKKEIIKWLHVGVSYPISNSTYMILVQCVLKKR